MKEETLDTLASVGPVDSLARLKAVVGEQWAWMDRYGDAVVEAFSKHNVPEMKPLPPKSRVKRTHDADTTISSNEIATPEEQDGDGDAFIALYVGDGYRSRGTHAPATQLTTPNLPSPQQPQSTEYPPSSSVAVNNGTTQRQNPHIPIAPSTPPEAIVPPAGPTAPSLNGPIQPPKKRRKTAAPKLTKEQKQKQDEEMFRLEAEAREKSIVESLRRKHRH